MYYLEPQFDRRKSFYKKASVSVWFGTITLTSYNTPVCVITSDKHIKLNGLYSQTTTRHIREFLQQHEILFASNPQYAALIESHYSTQELRKLVKPDTISKGFNYANCL